MAVALGAAPVYAEGRQIQTIQIEDQTYTVQVTENIKTRQTVVTDENDESLSGVYNKDTDMLTIAGKTYHIECVDETPSASSRLIAKAKDTVLSKKTFKIPGSVLAMGTKTAIIVISNLSTVAAPYVKTVLDIINTLGTRTFFWTYAASP